MRTAIDTDILSVLWGGEASATRVSATLDAASNAGSVVICAMVFVEVQGYRGVTRDFLERFLESTRVNVDWSLDRPVWQMAAERFGAYAERRRRLGCQPTNVLADFIIAAHATLHADRLITLDQRRYRADFSELNIVEL